MSRPITYQLAFETLRAEFAAYRWAALRYTLFLMSERQHKIALDRWTAAQTAFGCVMSERIVENGA